jgi:hypothetical protein
MHVFSCKIPYFWIYSQKVRHCCHRQAIQFPIRDHKGMSDSYTFTICSPDRCLVFRNETRSPKLTDKTTSSLNTHSYVWLLRHFSMTYYRPDCIIGNGCFLLLCGLNFYCKIFILYSLWNHHYTDYTTGNIVATPVAHTVEGFIIML